MRTSLRPECSAASFARGCPGPQRGTPGARAVHRGLFRPEATDALLSDPNGELTPLRGNKLWQVALLELWLQSHGIEGPAR